MKKLLSIAMLIAVLVSLCACGGKEQTAAPTQGAEAPTPATLDPSSPEAMYGHIDQTQPVDGVYKIWNAEGVKRMMENPTDSYELLCNVDMGGAELAPMGTFTGDLNGANFTISNFTLEGGEAADFGFVAVNQGTVRDLLLKDVTYAPGANAKNIGTLVGDNRGEIIRCTLTGTMTVDAAAEGANIGSLAGCSTGSIKNSATTTDLLVTAPGAANVGGIVGAVNGGIVEYTDTDGKIDVTGTNKTVGLIAGESQNIVYTYCAFIGESNTVDGKLFNNFTGTEDDELVVAFLDMVENHKMIVENSGLLTVAALKHLNVKNKKIVSVLSGGNMDIITMSSVVQMGLIYRDRIFTISVLLPDRPGELTRVSQLIAEQQGNIIRLEHNQFYSTNRNAAVELKITMEAFGTEHKQQIVSKLEQAGYRPKLIRPTL